MQVTQACLSRPVQRTPIHVLGCQYAAQLTTLVGAAVQPAFRLTLVSTTSMLYTSMHAPPALVVHLVSVLLATSGLRNSWVKGLSGKGLEGKPRTETLPVPAQASAGTL